MRAAGRSWPRSSRSSRRAQARASRPAHLDQLAERHIRAAGAMPSFMGYLGGDVRQAPGVPGSSCISIDDEVVHGIPGERRDPRRPDRVGRRRRDRRRLARRRRADVRRRARSRRRSRELVDATRLAMMAGIARGRAGRAHRRHLGGDRGRRRRRRLRHRRASSSATASARRCTRSRRSRTTGPASRGTELSPGICLAIEPMFTLGSHEVARRARRLDRVVTRDGSLAAHFEHTIAVTDRRPEILTATQPTVMHRTRRCARSEAVLRRQRVCRHAVLLIRYAFVCRPARAGTPS